MKSRCEFCGEEVSAVICCLTMFLWLEQFLDDEREGQEAAG